MSDPILKLPRDLPGNHFHLYTVFHKLDNTIVTFRDLTKMVSRFALDQT